MSDMGATSAFRGYRLQTLYALYRLISDPGLKYQPEGIEDLDIYSSSGLLLESAQVKAYGSDLSLSVLSPQKSDSFFRRSLNTLATNPGSKIKIISFGSIGPEMEKAWSGEEPTKRRVKAKLVEYGYTNDEAEKLFSIELVSVDELELKNQVFGFLKQTLAGGDPASAFDLLMYWIYLASEQGERVEYPDFIEKLSKVGRYLQERSAFHDEWFTSIHPLVDMPISGISPQRLAKEYAQGVDARYEHILADLDVVRSNRLKEIEQKFKISPVVIVHGASGQGKSTLAFRYLHDYIPSQWRFFVRFVEDKKHILKVASALSAHAKAINLPCTVYVDVSPSDRDWPELVRELSHLDKINVLVTIREEDWRRTTIYRTRFHSEEIEIDFGQEEAQNIYKQLEPHTAQFLSFDEAWSRFGGDGPLLEFIYFVTKNETLKSRIETQVRNLQDRVRTGDLKANELHLLRLVAIASAYDAKLDVRKLVEHLDLSEAKRVIDLYEQEYLIRINENTSTITGLHSVRSTLMLNSLLDDVQFLWGSIAVECLPLLMESDLENFLMYAFSRRRGEIAGLLKALLNFLPPSWKGTAGVLRSLLWLGVRDYTEANKSLIEQEYKQGGDTWQFTLDPDLAGIADDVFSRWWDGLPVTQERIQQIEAVRSEQTPKGQAFAFATAWLKTIESISFLPVDVLDWIGLAEVLFWANHLRIQQIVSLITDQIDLETAVEHLPLETLGDLIYALHLSLGDRFGPTIQKYRAHVASRYKHETRTFYLEDDGETVRAHFIPDSVLVKDIDERDVGDQESNPHKLDLHEEAMYRVNLLRKLLPDRRKYGSQGYGHRMGVFSPQHDETEKTGIDSDYFYPIWAQRVNTHFRMLGNYPHRPETWPEYARRIFALRHEIVDCFQHLQNVLNIYFRKQAYEQIIGKHLDSKLWGSCRQNADISPLLPKRAVDEWGFAGEGLTQQSDNAAQKNRTSYEQSVVLKQHQAYIEKLNEYLRSVSNFLAQGEHVIALNSVLGRTPVEQKQEVLRVTAEKGIRADNEFLATHNLQAAFDALPNLQDEFRSWFGHIFSANDLRILEEDETRLGKELWCVWYQFAFHPRKITQNATNEFVHELDDTLKRVKRQINKNLKALKQGTFSTYTAKADLPYEGENLPCVLIDINEPTAYWQAVEATILALQQALHTENNSSLRHYVIQNRMKDFAVIPLVHGKALSQATFIIPTYALKSGGALEHWFHYVPREISNDVWSNLNIPVWDRELFEPAISFAENLVVLSIHSLQAGDLGRFADEIEDEDIEVVEEFLQIQSEHLNKYLQNFLDIFVMLVNRYDISQIEPEERPFLFEAINLLVQMYEQILPSENHDGEMATSVDNIKEWSVRLEQLRDQIEQFRLLWITDVLNQI